MTLLKPIPEGEWAQINARMHPHAHTRTRTHTHRERDTLEIRHVKECVCFLLMSNALRLSKRWWWGYTERKRCSERERERERGKQRGKQRGRERDSHPLTKCYLYANDRQGIKAEENGDGDYSHECCCGNWDLITSSFSVNYQKHNVELEKWNGNLMSGKINKLLRHNWKITWHRRVE